MSKNRTNDANMAESMGAGAAPVATSKAPATTRKEAPPERQGVTRDDEALIIEVEKIQPDPDQPRKEFDEEEIGRLGESIQRYGQLQPIACRWMPALGVWYIISGERRYRAAIRAKLPTLRVTRIEVDEDEVRRRQLVENLLRSDLTGIEQARAFKDFIVKHKWTASDLAREFSITPTAVSRALGLLTLPEDVQALVEGDSISVSAAHEIAKIADPEKQSEVASRVATEKLGVAETKELVEEARASDTTERPREEGKTGRGRGKAKPKRAPGLKLEWSFKAEGGYTITVSRKKGVDPSKRSDAIREALLASDGDAGRIIPSPEEPATV